MYNRALEVLNILFDKGYLAYIVGGYPRDMVLGIKSNDIDICTNATPKEIIDIFDTENISDTNYGSVRVIYKNYHFDVTTFRKEINILMILRRIYLEGTLLLIRCVLIRMVI